MEKNRHATAVVRSFAAGGHVQCYVLLPIPSVDKGRHGFDGQKYAHTASSPLTIRQYSLRAFPCLDAFLLRQNCPHLPAMDIRAIFGFWR